MCRFSSMLRIVFSKKNIRNRYQRDFLEKSKKAGKIKFKNFCSKITFIWQETELFLQQLPQKKI